jgi:hypothetical protein
MAFKNSHRHSHDFFYYWIRRRFLQIQWSPIPGGDRLGQLRLMKAKIAMDFAISLRFSGRISLRFSGTLVGFCDFVLCDGFWACHFPRFCDLLCEIGRPLGGLGLCVLGVLILGVAGSQGKLVPATMSRSMETNPTKRGICEEEKWVSE